MPHKANGAMFIQYFISKGFSRLGNLKKITRSQAFAQEKLQKKLKDLRVRPKVPSHRPLRP
jgi:hypothetical protein